MRISKARAGLRNGKVCHRRWDAYGKLRSKGRRKSSQRSSTTSVSDCSGWRFSKLRRTIVVGFEQETDARRFWDAMRDRLVQTQSGGSFSDVAPRGEQPQAARARQTGDFQLPRYVLYLRQVARGQIPPKAEDPSRPHAGEDQGGCGGTATADASVDTRTG